MNMMMQHYEMEELLPIVARLTAKYTRNESTSVTYEKAEQLMGAVLYCIREYEFANCEDYNIAQKNSMQKNNNHQLSSIENISAAEAYERGYQKVLQKVERVRAFYNEMIMDFHAYGNENYRDTVEKGIPGFFKLYDAKFAPQDTIISMDYPTMIPIERLQGIDAIEQYIRYIYLEQKFLGNLQEEYVVKVLTNYQSDYCRQFYNICGIVLREILGWRRIRTCTQGKTYEELEQKLSDILKTLICEHYDGNLELLQYLGADIKDFCVELISGYGLPE